MHIVRVALVAGAIVLLAGCEQFSDRLNAYNKLQDLREEHSELEEEVARLKDENESLKSRLEAYEDSFLDMYRE